MMNRRAFLGAMGLLASPLAAEAQPTASIPRVGVLLNSPGTDNLRDLRQGLRALGYTEGQNIRLEVVSAEGKLDRLPALAAELVRRNVDLIVASGPQGVGASRRATDRIPIVMGRMDDVDAHGFVANLARPGGNITGLSFQTGQLAGKIVQLLKEIIPALSRVAVIWDTTGTRNQVANLQDAARALGLEATILELRGRPGGLDGVVSAARASGAQGLVLMASPGITVVQAQLAKLALQRRLQQSTTTPASPRQVVCSHMAPRGQTSAGGMPLCSSTRSSRAPSRGTSPSSSPPSSSSSLT